MDIKVKVQRKSDYYLEHVVLMSFMITSFVVCAWSLHPADVMARMSVDFNLVLTVVVLKLVVTSMLPTLSYISILDMYVYICFSFLAAVTVCHVALPRFLGVKAQDISVLRELSGEYEGEEDIVHYDHISFYIFAAGWLAFNFLFLVYFKWAVWKHRREFLEASHQSFHQAELDDHEVVDMGKEEALDNVQLRERLSVVSSRNLRSLRRSFFVKASLPQTPQALAPTSQ